MHSSVVRLFGSDPSGQANFIRGYVVFLVIWLIVFVRALASSY